MYSNRLYYMLAFFLSFFLSLWGICWARGENWRYTWVTLAQPPTPQHWQGTGSFWRVVTCCCTWWLCESQKAFLLDYSLMMIHDETILSKTLVVTFGGRAKRFLLNGLVIMKIHQKPTFVFERPPVTELAKATVFSLEPLLYRKT